MLWACMCTAQGQALYLSINQGWAVLHMYKQRFSFQFLCICWWPSTMANIMSITIPIYIQNIFQRWFSLHERQAKQEKFNLQERDLNANCTSWWPAFCLVQQTFKLLPGKHKETSIWSPRMIKVKYRSYYTYITVFPRCSRVKNFKHLYISREITYAPNIH